jgi:hypothetical protein
VTTSATRSCASTCAWWRCSMALTGVGGLTQAARPCPKVGARLSRKATMPSF